MSRLPIRWTAKMVRPYVDKVLLASPNVEGEETITIRLGTKKAFATRCVTFKDSKHTATALYEEYHELMDTLNVSERSLVYESMRTNSSDDILKCFNRFKIKHLERKMKNHA